MPITMRQSLFILVIIVVATVSLLDAVPVSQTQISSVSDSHQNTLSDQEDLTPIKSSDEGKVLVREKRTIGFLRTLFPGLSQIVDRKIQQITRWLFRVIGRLVLRGGNTGGGSSSDDTGDSGGRKVSITLPTYPPASDEDEDETDAPTSDSAVSESSPTTTQAVPKYLFWAAQLWQ